MEMPINRYLKKQALFACKLLMLFLLLAAIILPKDSLAASASKTKEPLNLTCDSIDYDEDTNMYVIKGNVKIVKNKTILKADVINWDREKDILILQGNADVVQDQTEISADKITSFLSDKRLIAENNVKLVHQNKKSTNDDKLTKALEKEKTTLTCTRLEFNTDKEVGSALGQIAIKQKGKTLFSEKGYFNLKNDYLELAGNVKGQQDNGQWLYKEKVVDDSDKTTETVVKEPMRFTVDRLIIKGKNQISYAKGNLHVIQDNRELKANTGQFDDDNKKLTMEGNVHFFLKNTDKIYFEDHDRLDETKKVLKDDTLITGDKLVMDTDKNDAVITGNPFIYQEDRQVKAKKIEYIDKGEKLFLSGEVELKQKSADKIMEPKDDDEKKVADVLKDETVLTADQAAIVLEKGKEMAIATGGVKITQKDKFMSANMMEYYEQDEHFTLKGNVVVEQNKGDWLYDKKIVEDDDKDTKDILMEKTTLTCDELSYSDKKKEGYAKGNILILQKERRFEASQAFYNDDKKELRLEGNVRVWESQKGWLNADKALINTDKGTYQAMGNAVGNIMLDIDDKDTK